MSRGPYDRQPRVARPLTAPGAGERHRNARDPEPPSADVVLAELQARARQALADGVMFVDSLPNAREWPGLLWAMFVAAPVAAATEMLTAFLSSPRLHRLLLRFSVATIVYWAALFVAILAYIGFVKVWAPHAGAVKTIWLRYGSV